MGTFLVKKILMAVSKTSKRINKLKKLRKTFSKDYTERESYKKILQFKFKLLCEKMPSFMSQMQHQN